MGEIPKILFCDILCAFVCQHARCNCVVKLESVERHLYRKHRIKPEVARRTTSDLLRLAEGRKPREIASRYFIDPIPNCGERPLPALPLLPIYDVLQCLSCKIYFNGMSSCRAHIRSAHNENDSHVNILQQLEGATVVKGQALFLGPARVFFPVSCGETARILEAPTGPSILPRTVSSRIDGTALSDEISLREKSANLTCSLLGIPEFLDSQHLTLERAFQLSAVEKGMHSKIVNAMLGYIRHFADMQPAVPLALVEGVKIRNGNNVASFSLSIEPRSKRRYAGVAARFLQLVVNLDSETLTTFKLSDRLICAGQEVMKRLIENEVVSSGSVHEFFSAMLLQEPRSSLGECVMIENLFKIFIGGYTCAVSSKRVRVGNAEDASHTAASLQYFCHIAALAEFLVNPIGFGVETGEDEESRFKRVQEMLSTAKCTPASYLRTVLHKTKSLSAGESPRINFVPCPNHELCGTVENIEVQMNSDCPGSLGFTVRKIREDVNRIVRNDLMRNFATPAGFSRKLLSFPDKINLQDPGYYFGEGHEAKPFLELWAESFARHLSRGPAPLLVSMGSGSERKWCPTKDASDWLRTVDKLSALLYVLVHLCGGGPPRVSEMIEAKLRNTAGSRRNLFIIKRRLAIIVSYSKTSRQAQRPKPIARFLDEVTSDILLHFVVFIKPVQCFFLRSSLLEVRATEDYIFCQSGEKFVERAVCREFSKALSFRGLPLNVSLYRQLRTGVAKAFLSENLSATNENLLFSQAGHTESTARMRYAGGDFNIGELSLTKLEGFFSISQRWHEMLGLIDTGVNSQTNIPKEKSDRQLDCSIATKSLVSSGARRGEAERTHGQQSAYRNPESRKRSISLFLSESQTKKAKERPSCERTCTEKKYSVTESILACARDVLGLSAGTKFEFKSEAQRAATFDCSLQTIVTGYSSTMIVVLPTGGGKTLCWATAALREQRVSEMRVTKPPITLLILPLVSLQQDMMRKCNSVGIRCGLWEERFRDGITVVICSIDAVLTLEYERYIMALSTQERIARIVLDEAHLTLLWEDLRRFDLLGNRIRPGAASIVPLVCLTATLPNSMISELQRVLHLDGSCMKLYKVFNSRSNISYQVRRVQAVSSGDMIALCSQVLRQEMGSMKPTDRVIVFCLTIKDCVMMYEVVSRQCPGFGACLYHGSMEREKRIQSFNTWINASSVQPIAMIATSAFSCGIDYSHVRLVLHAGGARTIVELAQESGRAGRDGIASKNIVLFNSEYMRNRTDASSVTSQTGTPLCFGDVHKVLDQNTTCRRQVIESFLNGSRRSPCQEGEMRCDVCERLLSSDKLRRGSCNSRLRTSRGTDLERNIVVNRKRVDAYPMLPVKNVGIWSKAIRRDGELLEGNERETPLLPTHVEITLSPTTRNEQAKWFSEQISLIKCAVCLFTGCRRNDHLSCMRAKCFRCMEQNAAHQSKECEVTPRGNSALRRCFFCGIPRSKNLHRNGSYDRRGRCEWEVPKNLALLIWRDRKKRTELIRKVPMLRDAKNIREVGHLLCGGIGVSEQTLLVDAVEYMYSTYVLGAK